ncbi:hypothetical protein ASPZODRAFT_1452745 [Penicilliopsis zonata CBS 506.65]|uniref:Uncharacterized protein n=1 Tax=Penicilliopsis zonata CBS 506.65 TaxID=1073090 RepID=A0A1L9SPZ4_9EURO|nr:hypothetical protein ASPZODRAFT_1452745 [Penicilliopsis zonata CBS 506.65]OJJ49319.1 hypothetical protein ASPZODRAFT_1452745 [Penicilliopsis zonata CBS 506.65]
MKIENTSSYNDFCQITFSGLPSRDTALTPARSKRLRSSRSRTPASRSAPSSWILSAIASESWPVVFRARSPFPSLSPPALSFAPSLSLSHTLSLPNSFTPPPHRGNTSCCENLIPSIQIPGVLPPQDPMLKRRRDRRRIRASTPLSLLSAAARGSTTASVQQQHPPVPYLPRSRLPR